MFVNCIVPYEVAVSNIGYKFTRSAYVIEGLGYNSGFMIQVLALWDVIFLSSVQFLNFIFTFKVLSYLYGKCAIFAYVIIFMNKLNFCLL